MQTDNEPNDSSSPLDTISSIGFLVNERPVAIYGILLRETSRQFIKLFDSAIWNHHLSLATSIPIEEVTHEHVVFVRLAVSHAEEHLFSLIFAFLQAPHCPDLWLYHYKPSDLPEMVAKVERGERILTQFKLAETSWTSITKALWGGLDEKRYSLTALVLSRLAQHFICGHGRDEYNGLKHGMRLSLGGTSISFSPGGSPDIMPPPDSYIGLGDSKFGSRFWSFEKMSGSKDHLRAKQRFSNWDFLELGSHLTHAAMLIHNMGTAFRVLADIDGDREFLFFTGDAAYADDPRKLDGFIKGESVANFDIPPSKRIDLEDIRKSYT